MKTNIASLASLIWSVADLLRGDFKQSQYGRIILPFTVLRRLECVLAANKQKVLVAVESTKALPEVARDKLLLSAAGQSFYNTSKLTLDSLGENQIGDNLDAYVRAFSTDAREVFEHFNFEASIGLLEDANLLYKVVRSFATVDLSPEAVDNYDMGLVFEELIRRFAESSNETAGEHFTPRDIVRLTTSLVFASDNEALTKPGVVRSIYDPTAGTGGFLSCGMEYLHELNPAARLATFGQELNPESYAICKADMLIKGQDISHIKLGNTLSDDQLPFERFDYCLSNPPFGVDWKKVEKQVSDEHQRKGFEGRFGPGLPRVSDGSLLFLMHLISKMRPASATSDGSRIGIILNGSPLFTGGAGSGESEIRRYVLENDLLDALVALPTDMFYNTGISTYIWILSNKKPTDRKGWVQLIDASSFWQKMRKSLGSKRKELSDEHIADITRLFGDFAEAEQAIVLDAAGKEVSRQLQLTGKTPPSPPNGGKVKIVPIARLFKNEAFGYTTLTVERPLRDEAGAIVLGSKGKQKGKLQPDSALRDTENVPLADDIAAYFKREVLPHAPDAWIDPEKSKVGYEIPFNRHFYVFEPPRSLHEIDEELKGVTANIMRMIEGLAE